MEKTVSQLQVFERVAPRLSQKEKTRMREDFVYIDEATCITLTTTKRGRTVLGDYLKEHGLFSNFPPLVKVLITLEDSYTILPNQDRRDSDIQDWYQAVLKACPRGGAQLGEEGFIKAVSAGLIGIRKVIWD